MEYKEMVQKAWEATSALPEAFEYIKQEAFLIILKDMLACCGH